MFFLKSSCCDSIINNILKQTGIRKRKKQIRKDSKMESPKRRREREKERKREREKARKRKRDKEKKR